MTQRKHDVAIRGAVEGPVGRALAAHERVVLAVSGGRDSMVMLEAAARVARGRIAAVATFDHGTGAAATEAATLAAGRARVLGLAVVRARAEVSPPSEAGWREARWRFLRRVAAERSAVIATAHTADDQVETVLMRVMRGAGARGLAGLYAGEGVVRPLLTVDRAAIVSYARRAHVGWVEDPSNQSRRFLRNRIRLDLLPALRSARPALPGELLAVARRAAEWRRALDEVIDHAIEFDVRRGELMVARQELRDYDARALGVLWPALAARAGVTLDHRGTRRLSTFTIQAAPGRRIQLSGGHEVLLHRDRFWLRQTGLSGAGVGALARDAQPLTEALTFGPWRFRRALEAPTDDRWSASLPRDRGLWVRPWAPGDRMVPAGGSEPRRVKGLLRDAGIDAARRAGWPVVVADEEIVWVPGVRRSDAATVRSGRPAWVFVCERIDD